MSTVPVIYVVAAKATEVARIPTPAVARIPTPAVARIPTPAVARIPTPATIARIPAPAIVPTGVSVVPEGGGRVPVPAQVAGRRPSQKAERSEPRAVKPPPAEGSEADGLVAVAIQEGVVPEVVPAMGKPPTVVVAVLVVIVVAVETEAEGHVAGGTDSEPDAIGHRLVGQAQPMAGPECGLARGEHAKSHRNMVGDLGSASRRDRQHPHHQNDSACELHFTTSAGLGWRLSDASIVPSIIGSSNSLL